MKNITLETKKNQIKTRTAIIIYYPFHLLYFHWSVKKNEWKIRRQHHVIFSVATDSFDNTRKIFWNHHVLLIAKVWTIYNIEQYSGHTVLTNVILHKRDNGASSKKRYYVKWQQCLDGSDTATTSINWAKLMFLLQIFESLQHLFRVNKNLFFV